MGVAVWKKVLGILLVVTVFSSTVEVPVYAEKSIEMESTGIEKEKEGTGVEEARTKSIGIESTTSSVPKKLCNMDKEHMKYVRATVTRMNYLLSGETDTKGLVVQLLNKMSDSERREEIIKATGAKGITVKQGKGGGVTAHRDIAFDFLMWLDPNYRYHLLCFVKEHGGKSY